jgi:hypothetical protein
MLKSSVIENMTNYDHNIKMVNIYHESVAFIISLVHYLGMTIMVKTVA